MVQFMKKQTSILFTVAALTSAVGLSACAGLFSSVDENALETPLTFTVPSQGPRTAAMCGPSHDEEMIFGLGSDGKKHYFAVGTDVRGGGITIWQSDDLVNWKDVGRVFNDDNRPEILGKGRGYNYDFNFVTVNDKGEYVFEKEHKAGANNYRLGGAQPFWAPCICFNEADQTYYLYYSCSAYGTRNSFIGCAKSKTLDKGWVDCGQLIHTRTGDGKRFNAIDPVVVHDTAGKPWMGYGSFFGGIAILPLNPQDPSKLLQPGTHGKTISSRDDYDNFPYEQDGFEGKKTRSANGTEFVAYGQEGASIIYNPETGYYYLFTSYDRLAWTYHCRVGRSKKIDGPYVDYNGNPMIYLQEKQGAKQVNGTKIIGAYRWSSANGAGWAATGHTTLFYTGDNELMFGSNSKWNGVGGSFVGLRKVLWTEDGWPVLTPCLYGGESVRDSLNVPRKAITANAESAEWDFIVFSVDDDTSFHRTDASRVYTLAADGSILNQDGCGWTLSKSGNGTAMTVSLPDGVKASGKAALGWDQDRRQQTVVFSGLTKDGIPVWGQRSSAPFFPEAQK